MQSSPKRKKKSWTELTELGYCGGCALPSPNVHLILLLHMKSKEIKAENDPSTHRFAKNNNKTNSFYFLSGVDMHVSPLQEPVWAQVGPLHSFALMLGFCLTYFYCGFLLWLTAVSTQKGTGSRTASGKNEVSLGSASRILESLLVWERVPWHMCRHSCHLGIYSSQL